MPTQPLHLNFFGAGLTVLADGGQWLEGIAAAFPFFVDSGAPPADAFELTIIDADALPARPDMPLTWEGLNNAGVPSRIYESETEAVFVADDRVTRIESRVQGRATAFALPDSRDVFFSLVLIPTLDAALFHGGQHLLHAACLVEKASGNAILVSAPSGSGKTTTAMTLAHDGFSLMTDDVSVVMPRSGGAMAWGMPRALKVHRRTAELLPWIGPLPDRWDASGEQAIGLQRISDRISVMPPEPRPLSAIILLGPRSPEGHRFEPLSKPEMLTMLAHDNVAARSAGMTPKAIDRFTVFADMVRHTPAFLLRAGEDLAGLPAMVSRVLAGLPQAGRVS